MNKHIINKKIMSLLMSLSMALFFMPNYVMADDVEEPCYDGYIVTLKDGSDIEPAGKGLEEIAEGEIYYADTKQDISEEIPISEIESIEPNYEIDLLDSYNPNDPKYQSSRWQQEMIKIQEVWAEGYNGQGVNDAKTPVVAVIDTGIVGTGSNPKKDKHEDLDYSNILEGYNGCYDEKNYNEDFTDDGVGHGTIVAGIIAATTNNGVGIAGNMPSVKIRPYRCFYPKKNKKTGKIEPHGTTAYELKCIQAAIEDGVDVINISAGNNKYYDPEQKLIQEANRKGIIVCAAAGNDGNKTLYYPASHEKVISVGSVNKNQIKSTFSNYNKKLDVVAPGEEINGLGIKSTKSYTTDNYGTSFSCPHVSALAALCKSINPDINHDAFFEILKETSSDLGAEGYDTKYGWGLINFSAVLERMLTGDSSPIYKVKIKKISSGKKQFKVYWDRNIEGTYQVQYSTNSKFTKKARKTYTVKKNNATGVKVSKLKSKKKYYVRIRAKVKINGKESYTSWSPTKSIKTK